MQGLPNLESSLESALRNERVAREEAEDELQRISSAIHGPGANRTLVCVDVAIIDPSLRYFEEVLKRKAFFQRAHGGEFSFIKKYSESKRFLLFTWAKESLKKKKASEDDTALKAIYIYVKRTYSKFLEFATCYLEAAKQNDLLSQASITFQAMGYFEKSLEYYFGDQLVDQATQKLDRSKLSFRECEERIGFNTFNALIAQSRRDLAEKLHKLLYEKIKKLLNESRESDWSDPSKNNYGAFVSHTSECYMPAANDTERYFDIEKVKRYLVDDPSDKDAYKKVVETPFFDTIVQFYTAKASEWRQLPVFTEQSTDSFLNFIIRAYKMEIGTGNTGRFFKVCEVKSKLEVEKAVVGAFVTPDIPFIESSLEAIFGNLLKLTFDGDNDVVENASDYLKDTAAYTFLLLAKWDAIYGPSGMKFTTLIADKFSNMVRENFSKLIQFYSPAYNEEAKSGKKFDKKNIDLFCSKFFNLYEKFCELHSKIFDFESSDEHIKLSSEKIRITVINKVYMLMANDRLSKIYHRLEDGSGNSYCGDSEELRAERSNVMVKPSFFGKSFTEILASFLDSVMGTATQVGVLERLRTDHEYSESLKKKILELVMLLEDKMKFVEAYCVPFFFYRIVENNYDKDGERNLVSFMGSKLPLSSVTKLQSLCKNLETSDIFKGRWEETGKGPATDILDADPQLMFTHYVPRQKPLLVDNSETTPCFAPFRRTFDVLSRFVLDSMHMSGKMLCVDPNLPSTLIANGMCDVVISKSKEKAEFTNMGFVQAYILSVFDPKYCQNLVDAENYLTLRQIKDLACLNDQSDPGSYDLYRKALMELIGRKILVVGPPIDGGVVSKKLEHESRLKVNPNLKDFSKGRKTQKFSSNVMRWEDKTAESINSALEESRKVMIQASIIRIMKSRKRLSHKDLFGEARAQLRDLCDIRSADDRVYKKQVEKMINEGYIMRDENDPTQFIYIG